MSAEMREVLSWLAGIIFFVGYIPYVIAIIRGVKPSKVTWLIWAILDTIAWISMYIEKVLNRQIIGAAVGAWIVFLLACKYGKSGWNRLDRTCLVGAGICVVLLIFGGPLLAILATQVATLIGASTTFRSAWEDPANEDPLGWTIFLLSCVIALIALPSWELKRAAQPVIFTVIDLAMVLLLYIPYRPTKRSG